MRRRKIEPPIITFASAVPHTEPPYWFDLQLHHNGQIDKREISPEIQSDYDKAHLGLIYVNKLRAIENGFTSL